MGVLSYVIHDWNIIEEMHKGKKFYFLTGHNDDRFFYPIRTSYIKFFNRLNMQVKTRNSIYVLKKESREMMRIDSLEFREYCEKINSEMIDYVEEK